MSENISDNGRNRTTVSRRSCLKLGGSVVLYSGIGASSAGAESISIGSEQSGYGLDGYGTGMYGAPGSETDDETTIFDPTPENLLTSFSSGALAAWSGETEEFSIETRNALQGENHLHSTADSFTTIHSTPGDGLSSYPETEAGVIASMWYHPNEIEYDIRWLIGHDGTNQTIQLEIGNNANRQVRLRGWEAGNRTFNQLGNAALTRPEFTNQWLKAVMYWDPDNTPTENNLGAWVEDTDGTVLDEAWGRWNRTDANGDGIGVGIRMQDESTDGIDFDSIGWEYIG